MINQHPLITIQILSWNKAEETLKAIQSALDQTYPHLEIVVVDNASEDDSVQRIRQQYPQIKVVELDKNYGCPEGRNRGIPHCNGEFIFYMDNDALLHSKAVEQAYKAIKQDEHIGVVGGVVFPFTDYAKADVNCPLPDGDRRFIHSWFHGGVSLHRKSMYKEVGMYPGHYFYGGEEGYLTMKMLACDYYVVKDDSVILWHIPSELSNGKAMDLVNRQVNSLANRITFWPIEFVVLYFLKILIRHPYQAVRYKVFSKWLVHWPGALRKQMTKAGKSRKPLPRRTIQLFYSLSIRKNQHINQAKWLRVSYGRSLLYELFKG